MTIESDAPPALPPIVRESETVNVKIESNVPALWQASAAELDVLRKTLTDPNITETEFRFFLAAAKHMNLDPFKKQVYLVKYEGKPTLQTGIDGYRALAVRTGELEGQDPPVWVDKVDRDGETRFILYGPAYEGREVWPYPATHPPFAAIAAVWRKGIPRSFTYVAHYDSFVRKVRDRDSQQMRPMALWRTMPEVMLFKCALSQCLRAAFPDELAGVYTAEEMDQAANEARAPERGIATEDMAQITAAIQKAADADKTRLADWLKAQGYTGEKVPDIVKGKQLTANQRVLNDFANNGTRPQVESVLLILQGTDPIIEGDVKAFDPDAVGGYA